MPKSEAIRTAQQLLVSSQQFRSFPDPVAPRREHAYLHGSG